MIDLIARHAARALLSLDGIRRSDAGAEQDAYRQVHDLMGDLGSMKVRLQLMHSNADVAAPVSPTTVGRRRRLTPAS